MNVEPTGNVKVIALDAERDAKRLSIKGRQGVTQIDVEDIDSLVSALYSLRSGQIDIGASQNIFPKKQERVSKPRPVRSNIIPIGNGRNGEGRG